MGSTVEPHGSASQAIEDSQGRATESTPERRRRNAADRIRLTRRRVLVLKWLLRFFVVAALAGAVFWELRTSQLQSIVFSEYTSGVYHYVDDGPSDAIRFPDGGPYDERLGYADIPSMAEELTDDEYRITRQARVSERFMELVDRGLFPPYTEKQRAGLAIRDRRGNRLHEANYPVRHYESFDDIPDLLVETLLFVENRSLLDKERPHRNPALEPDRFLHALAEVLIREIADGEKPSGGSTLATQLEKFRHSDEGRTVDYSDKFQQMMSASIRAYLDGDETLDDQRHIVLTYLNSVPLSAVRGFGEVFGIRDGLYAWYGSDADRVDRLLKLASESRTRSSTSTLREQARAYRQILELIIAQRRPSYLLRDGREDLRTLTNQYLEKLTRHGILSERFRDLAREADVPMRGARNYSEEAPWSDRKLVYSLRTHLLDETRRDSLYALDKLDLQVETTLDYDVQRAVERRLHRLEDPEFVEKHRLDRWRLLDKGDPSEVVYSFTLYEQTEHANKLRIQADTFDGPFNVNEGVKLNLGSTAKLRTTASYLQIVADLWESHTDRPAEELESMEVDRRDRITRWVRDFALEHPEASLESVLDAAMKRRYSAKPDAFFTGGGLHHFENFSHKYNNEWPTVRTGLQKSINLVFVRLMRDIVRYHMFRLPDSDPKILMDADHPKREQYLEQFADYEGEVFLKKFWDKYEGWNATQSLIRMQDGRAFTARRLAVAYRTIRPDADIHTFEFILEEQLETEIDTSYARHLYDEYDPDKLSLNDLGYLARIHPLELWLLRYKSNHPDASWAEVVDASDEARQASYEWLKQSSRKSAQDRRIRIVLEREAFDRLHDQWRDLGYPFDELVPSFASALGSSSDRPAALSELMGAIVNDGVRKPTVRFRRLHFAEGTPFETKLTRTPRQHERVLRKPVADVLQDSLLGVVDGGTAERLEQYDLKVDGRKWEVAGKTGTGDNRRDVRNRHGTLIKSIPQNRTATFVFNIDERFYGALTAYVPGKKSGEYEFTSSLAVPVLGLLAPKLRPLWWHETDDPLPPRPVQPPQSTPKHLVSASDPSR